MISESITVLILLVALSSPGSGQNSSIIPPSVMPSSSVETSSPSQSTQTITPSTASATQGLPSASASVTTTGPTTEMDQTVTPTRSTTKPDQTRTPTGPTPTPSEKSLTCAKLSFIVKMAWNEIFANKSSVLYKQATAPLSNSLRSLYNSAKFDSVELTEMKLTEKAEQVLVNATLCLIVKESDGVSIEDMFINKVNSGELDGEIPVKNDSAKFEPIGVTFTDWKAKEGECKKKCEGAAGPFDIERKCQAERHSCNGLKNKSDESDDCVKYCPSDNAAITVPSFILAIGIFLSFSFQ